MSDIARFESLGDNCEFGFVQRFLNVEPGGLLRWCITSPEDLIGALDDEFKNIYRYENLTPSYRDMVLDSQSGIYFHTGMYSENNVFIEKDTVRREIYNNEISKINYLVEKLMGRLRSDNTIFVYKRNGGIDLDVVTKISERISRYGKSSLLYVTDKHDGNVGLVRHHSENIYIANIDRFAPYESAHDVSLPVWQKILKNACIEIDEGFRAHAGQIQV